MNPICFQSLIDEKGFRLDTSIVKKHHKPLQSPIFCPSTPMKPPSHSRVYGCSKISFSLDDDEDSDDDDPMTPAEAVNPFSCDENSSSVTRNPQFLSKSTIKPRIEIKRTKRPSPNRRHSDSDCFIDSNNKYAKLLTQPKSVTNIFENEFDVVGLVGQGTFGRVFKVRHRKSGEIFAIKISSKQFRNRFERARALKEVVNYALLASENPHPNCVRYFRAWEHDGHLYIQTEFCDRGTLKSYLSFIDKELEESTIWCFLKDIALGIKHVHDKHLIHLDIKPDNIFLTINGTLKLGDFGISIHENDFKQGMEGTAAYLAPEVVEPDVGQVNSAADLFSLGLILFEMAADIEIPIHGPAWKNIRNQTDIVVPPERSKEMHELVSQLLLRDPIRRAKIDHVLTQCSKMLRKSQTPVGLPPSTRVTPLSEYWTPGSSSSSAIQQQPSCSPISPSSISPRNLFDDFQE